MNQTAYTVAMKISTEERRAGMLFLFAVTKKRSAFLVSSYFFLIFA